MAWSQSDLDALSAAITSGLLRVRFADGRETTYQNVADMLALRKTMKAEIAAAASQVTGRLVTVGRICRR